jgi:uncharacterized repeat protein (TIGR04076 family)
MSARITVIKRSMNMDVIRRYLPESVATAELCRDFTEGQTFEIKGPVPTMPEAFCEVAWQTMERNVARACKGEHLMRSDAFPCCTDGLRPVTFHIEPIEDS